MNFLHSKITKLFATERPARPHRLRRQDSDLVITTTLEGRTARRRPLPATGLRLADYEAPMENPPMPYPFGLEGAGSAYQNAIHHLFADHVERDHVTDLYMIDLTKFDQPAPVVNMVNIRQLPSDSLHDRSEDVMANYLPIMLNQSANNWLLSLWENSTRSWDDERSK
jgi:hypothetical protein